MTYQITVKLQGKIETVTTQAASNAIQAIAQTEQLLNLKAKAQQLGEARVTWNGYEFEARRVD